MQQTANQRWRQSGSTLSFKNFLEREKAKMASIDGGSYEIILNKPLNDSVQASLATVRKEAGYKTEISNKTVFGINKTVLIISGLVILAGIGYKIYKTQKK